MYYPVPDLELGIKLLKALQRILSDGNRRNIADVKLSLNGMVIVIEQ
jgi:hypothetical protein